MRVPLFSAVVYLCAAQVSAAVPVIQNGRHSPVLPVSSDAVQISAEISGAAQALLHWRKDGAAAFQSIPMSASGAAWSGAIPPQPNGTIVEFSVEATDGTNTASWPGGNQTALLRVEDSAVASTPWVAGAAPVWRMVVKASDAGQVAGGPAVRATTIIRDGTGLTVRHGCELRLLEASPKGYSMAFPAGQPWQGREAVMLSADRPHCQAFGAAVFRRAGLPVAATETIELRLNGANAAAAGAPSYGRFVCSEPFDDAWATRQFPSSPGGNLYLMDDSGTGTHGALAYETPPTAANYAETYLKLTNQAAGDYSDIIALTDKLSNAPQATYRQEISQRLDLDQWLRCIALDSLLGNAEPGLQDGRGTDAVLYHLPSSDRILLVPHELRAVAGLGGGTGTATRSIFSSGATAGLSRLMTHQDIVPDYVAKVQELLDTLFTSASLDSLLTEVMGGWVPAPEIAVAKQFIVDRRSAALAEIPQAPISMTVTGNAAAVEGVPQSANGTATVSGNFPMTQVSSILVNGQPATLNFRAEGAVTAGTWSFDATSAAGTLRRGMNHFLVEFFDGVSGTGSVIQSLEAMAFYSGGGTEVSTITAPPILTDTLAAPGGFPPAAPPANSGPWRYLAAAPPAGWQSENFDDSAWLSGTPHFGFGDGDERTVVAAPAGRAAWYFRRTFTALDPAAYTALTLRLIYDDAAIVYINGVEVTRKNIAASGVTDATWASSSRSTSTETVFESIPLTASLNRLHAGVNTLAVEIHNAQNNTDLSFDAEITATRPAAPDVRWTPAGSPYHLAQNVSVPAGVTLAIEPGVSVFFSPGRKLTVNGVLRVLGTAYGRVRFSHVPGATPVDDPVVSGTQLGPPKWDGIVIQNSLSPDNLIAYADFDNAQIEGLFGSITLIKAACTIDHCSFRGTYLHAIRGLNCSLAVLDSWFPDSYAPGTEAFAEELANDSEYVQVGGNPVSDPGFTGAWPTGGVLRFYRNTFGGVPGHNDVIDITSGKWGVTPVLDVQDNVFLGPTGDEGLDLGGDAYIAGNFFANIKKDQWVHDLANSNAVSGGAGAGASDTTVVMARNVFTRVDHAATVTGNVGIIFEHNTVACQHNDYPFTTGGTTQTVRTAVVSFFIPGVTSNPGDGAYLGYNIFFGAAGHPPGAAGGFPRVFAGADLGGSSTYETRIGMFANFIDPATQDPAIGPRHPNNVLHASWQGVTGNPAFADIAADDYSLAPQSTARGAAPHGVDYGASIPKGCYLGDVPPAITAQTSANIIIGGPGIFAFKWRLNSGAWSAPVSIAPGVFPRTGPTVRTANLVLSSLAAGTQTLEVTGQDFAGNWTPDSAAAKVSWTVDTTTPLLFLNEILTGAAGSIELHNEGTVSLTLTGWSLSDTPAVPGKFALTSPPLAAGGWLTLPASQTGLSLPAGGGSVYLFHNGTLMDFLTFGAQGPGYSLGRSGRDRQWVQGTPTPNAANNTLTAGSVRSLRFNEWVAGTNGWVELVNTDALPVILDGLHLSANLPGAPAGYVFPPHSLMPPGGFLVLSADGSIAPGHLPFTLDSRDGSLTLLDGATVLDSIDVSRPVGGSSQGRATNGSIVFFPRPTPGSVNGPTAPATLAAWLGFYGVALSADEDRDGMSSLAEYALGTDPLDSRSVRSIDLLPRAGRNPDGSMQLTFALPQTGEERPDITYIVETAANLKTGPWNAVAAKTGSGTWSGAATVTTGPAEGGFVPVSVRLTPPQGAAFFVRLRFVPL